ncbi:RsmE family RNA methyltransferase [Candidatus Peribacteria bacterium]|nr:RsmE family RNA methyltransferase [Candidatus Peribacteria bacterium]
MHRFFSHIPLTGEIKIFPDTPHFHQIYHVFRAKKGDRMIFFEAGGNDILYEIVSIDKKSIFCFQREVIKKQELNNKKIHLFQAYPHKIATMELIVQKSVELGIV